MDLSMPLLKCEVHLMQEDVLVYGFQHTGIGCNFRPGPGRRLFTPCVGAAVVRFRNASERNLRANVRRVWRGDLEALGTCDLKIFARSQAHYIFETDEANYMKFFRYLAFMLDLTVFAHRYKKNHLMDPAYALAYEIFDLYLKRELGVPFWVSFFSLCDLILKNSPEHGRPIRHYRNPSFDFDINHPRFDPENPLLHFEPPPLPLDPNHSILNPDRIIISPNNPDLDADGSDSDPEDIPTGLLIKSLRLEDPDLAEGHSDLVAGHPDLLGTNPDLVAGNPDLVAGNPDLLGTNPNLTGTNPDLPETNPDLTGTNPDLPETNPDLSGANSNLAEANPLSIENDEAVNRLLAALAWDLRSLNNNQQP